MSDEIKSISVSPCINKCCLDEDDICLGCFRSIDEITGWNEATDCQKSLIIKNCTNRKSLHVIKFQG
jgi:predicted Fe-S protein YdhL (DUF1289 family)